MSKTINISILWDFDGTLTPDDSTTKFIDELLKVNIKDFWKDVKRIRGNNSKKQIDYLLASDAPIWMHLVSEYANKKEYRLNESFFNKKVSADELKIDLFNNCKPFLKKLKEFPERKNFENLDVNIEHFIITAGLQDLVRAVFKNEEVKQVFGCKYQVEEQQVGEESSIRNIPVFCMDQTMKTRSIFEISKGIIFYKHRKLNQKILENDLWCPISNMIYIGDGPTDIPSISVIRKHGGMGVILYNESKSDKDHKRNLDEIKKGRRADLVTKADFSKKGTLFNFIQSRCVQICQRYEAQK